MPTTHFPARPRPSGLPFLCLAAATALALFLFTHRGCARATSAALPPVSATVPVPAAPKPTPPTVDPLLPAVALAQCPERVRAMVVHLRGAAGWASRPGIRGGRVFRNYEGVLPRAARYREYDVVAGRPRTAERIVVSLDKSNFYWTQDHYRTFTPILLP